jgi:flavin reductase (DIM6/NTAB) family NADH-FMN oxidoreductase RutF
MDLDPAAVPARDTYRFMSGLITPRPIAWVSTVSARGIPNLAPFSFFNGVAASPPTVVFSCVNQRDGTPKDTARNLEVVPELVVNIVSRDVADRMNVTSEELPYEVNELERAGLTPLPSVRVRPPRVGEARAHLECEVHQIVRVGDGALAANLVIARILLIHVDDDVLDDRGAPDPRKLETVGRMGGDLYARTTDLFALTRPKK